MKSCLNIAALLALAGAKSTTPTSTTDMAKFVDWAVKHNKSYKT